MVLYLGCDCDAPRTAEWSQESPSFHVVDVPGDVLEAVRQKLPHQHLRYVGSHEGCGCGFRREMDGVPIIKEGDEAVAEAYDHSELVRYLMTLAKQDRHVQIFGCWSGDEGQPIAYQRDCSVQELCGREFMFRELEIITLK